MDDEQTSSTLAALRAEQAGYTARGLDDRAAQVQSQIDAYTGAGAERAAAPPAKRTRAANGRGADMPGIVWGTYAAPHRSTRRTRSWRGRPTYADARLVPAGTMAPAAGAAATMSGA